MFAGGVFLPRPRGRWGGTRLVRRLQTPGPRDEAARRLRCQPRERDRQARSGACARPAPRGARSGSRAPRDRRRAPNPAAAGAGADADPGEQRGAEHPRERFSLRLRPGAGIHHGQQQRRLHADQRQNRHGVRGRIRDGVHRQRLFEQQRGRRAPAWAPSRTRPRWRPTVSTRSPPAASLSRPPRRISW